LWKIVVEVSARCGASGSGQAVPDVNHYLLAGMQCMYLRLS
jgi:hypothetical protein